MFSNHRLTFFLLCAGLIAVCAGILLCSAKLDNPADPGSSNYVGDKSYYDKTPPLLTFNQKYDSLVTDGDSIALFGTVHDTNGISLFLVDSLSPLDSFPTWSITVALSIGENSLVVIAIDSSYNRNERRDTLHIFRTATPQPPSNVVLSLTGKYVRVNWTDNSSNETGFIIEKSPDNKTFTACDTVVADTVAFTDASPFSPLTPYYYRVASLNSAGASMPSAANFIVYPSGASEDTTGPALVFVTPTSGATVNATPVTVYVKATDSSGIKSVTINNVVAVYEGTNWKASVPLSPGVDTITANANDNSAKSNGATQRITITYNQQATDAVPPVISFVSPGDRDTVPSASVQVVVSAIDASGSVLWVRQNGNAMSFSEGNFIGTASLVPGINLLVVQASDNTNNVRTDTLHVYYNPQAVDNTPPTITIATPQKMAYLSDSTVTVSGTALDNSGISSVTVDGAAAAFSAPNYIATAKLLHGLNTISVKAVDSSSRHNAATDSIAVIHDRPPVFLSVKNDTSITTGTTYAATLAATDPDGDQLSYQFLRTPKLSSPTLSGNNTSATLSGYSPAAAGVDTFVVLVKDVWNESDTIQWKIFVNPPQTVNQPPAFTTDTATIPTTVVAGQDYTVTLMAVDPNNDVLKYGLTQSPGGMKIDSLSGKVTWTPQVADTGSRPVTATVRDTQYTKTISWDVRVAMYNRKPVLATPGNKTVNENQQLSFTLSASDSDGNALTYSLPNAPAGASLSGSGAFTWIPTHSQAGTYPVTLFVIDNGVPPLKDSTTISIVVSAVNRKPVLASPGNKTVNENQQLSFTVSAVDSDGNTITYAMHNGPSGATLGSASGAFAWTPTFSQAGTYPVTFLVTDNGTPAMTDSVTISIVVSAVNRKPVLASPGNKTVNENQQLSFAVSAVDSDGNTITYAMHNSPSGATLGSASGAFSWMPTYSQAGTYLVTFLVTDNGTPALTDSTTISIVVSDVNRKPVLAITGNKTVNENQQLSFTLSASDPDANTLTYAVHNAPSGATLSGDVFTWTPTYSQSGTYPVTFLVTDNGTPNLTDSMTITIVVADVDSGNVTYALTVTATNGTVTETPDKVLYDSGSVVGLKAHPDPGYHFVNWTGNASGALDSVAVVMNGTKNVTANFLINATYQLTVSAGTGGTISVPASSPYTVSYGIATQITALAASGYKFVKWTVMSGNATIADSNAASSTVTLSTGNASLMANFEPGKYVGWSFGYWTTWSGHPIANVNFNCYTHLAYFDGSINMPTASSGTSFTTACHNNKTIAIKSLGGAGAGTLFTTQTTSANLTNYVNTVVAAMQAQNFDGLDIDWEDNVNGTQLQALCNAIAAKFATMTPKPILTFVSANYLAQYAGPVYSIVNQINVMSFYELVNAITTELNSFTSLGVPKNKLGIGYGYDTDQEVDAPNTAGNGPNGNPADIDAKIQYTINNGYGGIVIWEVGRAPTACDSVTAHYVNKN